METHILRSGTTLQNGKYKIVRFISSGGFGCTYEAIDTLMDTRVAIKEFFVKDFCNRDAETQHITLATQNKRGLIEKLHHKFVDEARAIYQMKHDNIVRVYGFFEENNTAYYVMEYIDGESLHDVLKRRGSLSESEALGYIRQVAEALKYVHSKNRLHLDIKPANIMVDAKGHAILIDFGASKHYDEGTGENTTTMQGLNTPGYAPYEQTVMGVTEFKPASDIYALGATLYKLLTGVTPPNSGLIAIKKAVVASLPGYISDATKNAIQSAMKLHEEDRPQDVDAFLSLLNEKVAPTVGDEDTIIEGEAKDEEKRKIVEEAKTIMKLYPDGFNYYVKIGVLTNSPLELSDCQEIIYMKSAIVCKQNELHEAEKKIREEARTIMNSYPEGGNYYVRTGVLSGSLLELSDCQKIINMKSQIIYKQNEFVQEQERKKREETARKATEEEARRKAEEEAAKKSGSKNSCLFFLILFVIPFVLYFIGKKINEDREKYSYSPQTNNVSNPKDESITEHETHEVKDSQGNLLYHWTGSLESGSPHGGGIAEYPYNDAQGRKEYVGKMYYGKRADDAARLDFTNGDVYRGSFVDDDFNTGEYTCKETGEKFTGEFKNNQPFTGEWTDKNGKRIAIVKNGK